jgi:hypothetical protein
MIAYFMSQFPSLADAGVSGYPQIFKNVYSYLSPTIPVTGLMGLVLMLDTTNSTDITSLFDPIFNYINTTWSGEFAFTATPTWYPSHYAWYEVNYDPSSAGYENVMSSRLLDREALTGNLTKAKEAYELFADGGGSNMFMVSGKGVHDAVPRGGSNAVLPAWRSTYVHASKYMPALASFSLRLERKETDEAGHEIAANIPFQSLNATAREIAIAASSSLSSGLRELAPTTGAYMNEGAGRYEPDWQRTFWGDNYERLLKIKKTVDPDDTLWCQPVSTLLFCRIIPLFESSHLIHPLSSFHS